jgi:hypothetical protein
LLVVNKKAELLDIAMIMILIEKLFSTPGKDKDYKMNESYDYFEIGDKNRGMRTKREKRFTTKCGKQY